MGQLMLNRLPDHEKLYEHILRRDPELDGVVYVGV
jgi:methylphosphotriester-DNA--protein-cysteine methyltransferase